MSRFELVLLAALAASTAACGGSQKEPAEPEPLAQPDDQTAAPSSKKVESGLEALKAGKFPEAEAILGEATKESPEDPQAAYYYGVALEGVEKPAEAEQSYRRALSLEPKLTEASQNLSALLLGQGKALDALAVADAGLKHAPQDGGLLTNRAMALEASESPEALAAFEKAIAKSPEEPWLRLNYAAALSAAGKVEEAKKALAQVPVDDPQLAAQVAQIYAESGDFAGCVTTLDKALAKKKLSDLLVQRGVCKHSQKDEVGAGKDLAEAVATDEGSAAAHYYYGQHLLGQKKKADAKTHLGKAAELGQGTPIGEKASQALVRIK